MVERLDGMGLVVWRGNPGRSGDGDSIRDANNWDD